MADSTKSTDENKLNAHYGQMALALFDDLAINNLTIDNAPTEIGYHRADFFLDLDGMSLSGRRALDVAYFLVAQTETGLDNPYYTRHTQGEFTTHVVDLEFFKWLMAYTSNNRNHLRSVLRQGQKAAVEVVVHRNSFINSQPPGEEAQINWTPAIRNQQGDKTEKIKLEKDQSWVSVPLMGTVGIDQSQIYFKVHAQLEPYIKSPLRSHFLDLRLLFSTLRGRILYDKIQPYIDDGITPWFEVIWLKQAMECTSKAYEEFKYFNARALSKAIEDVKSTAHIKLETLIDLERNDARRVSRIRFKITKDPKADNSQGDQHLAQSQESYRVMVNEFGLNKEQIHRITKNRSEWTDERIGQAIEYTRFQIEQGKVKRSVAGYFIKALEEHYVLGSATKSLAQLSTPDTPDLLSPPASPVVAQHTQQLNTELEEEQKESYQRGSEIARSIPLGAFYEQASLFLNGHVARLACLAHQVDLSEVKQMELNPAHPLWFDFCVHLANSNESN